MGMALDMILGRIPKKKKEEPRVGPTREAAKLLPKRQEKKGEPDVKTSRRTRKKREPKFHTMGEQSSAVPDYTSFGRKPQPQSMAPPTPVMDKVEPEIGQIKMVINDDGSTSTYKDYNPNKSYISQIGKYEHDFWSREGQKERVKNAFDTSSFRVSPTAIGGKHIPVVSESLTGVVDVSNAAALIYGAGGLYSSLSNMNKVGGLIMAGDTMKAASLIAPAAASGAKAKVGLGVTTNTKTAAAGLNLLKGILGPKTGKTAVIGFIAYLMFQETKDTIQSAGFVESDKTNFIQSLGFHTTEFRDSGMNVEADELLEMAEDLKDGLDEVMPFIPFGIGGYFERSKISKYTLELDRMLDKHAHLKLENSKFSDGIDTRLRDGEDVSQEDLEKAGRLDPYGAAAKILKNQAVSKANPSTATDVNGDSVYGSVDENGNYIQSATELAKAKWEEENKNKDALGNDLFGYVNENGVYVPSYTELQKRIESQQYYKSISGGGSGERAEFEPPSSLNFGLLKTPGGYQPTSKDDPNVEGEWVTDTSEIAMYYFGISYDQLTDEQKSLVDMMVM